MTAGLARVTISAPRRRVDVALPEHVPLAELLPDLLRHAGEDLADDGEKHGGWVLRRGDGAALSAGRGLQTQGVRDGEVLHLVPAVDEWPEIEHDDVVEAIAEGARRRGGAWTPSSTRAATLAAAAVPLALGLFALLTAAEASAGRVGLGLAALLTVAATALSRAYARRAPGVVLAGYALPYAFVGGAALVASPGPALWRSIGASELLAGSVSVLAVTALGAAGVLAGARMFAAAATASLLAGPAAAVGLFTSGVAAAAVLISALACGIAVLPLVAVRLGGMPRPSITPRPSISRPAPGEPFADREPVLDPVGDQPFVDREAVFDAVARTEELLAGMLLGHAVAAAGAFAVLASAGTPSARLLIGAAATALLLRSRLFVTRRQRVPLLAAGLAGVTALGVDLLRSAPGPAAPVAVAVAATLVALLVVAAGAVHTGRPPSPYVTRAADLLDALAVISVIPVACAVTGLYSAVSGLT